MDQKQSQNGAQPAAGEAAAAVSAGGTVAGGAAAQGQKDTITTQTEQTAAAAMPSREDIERAAVLAYERQHGLKDGKPAEGAQPATQTAQIANAAPAENGTKEGMKEGAEGAPAWAQGVLEAVERLAGRVAEMEQTRVETARREELLGLVARLPEPMRAVYARLPLGGLSEAAWGEEKARVAKEVEGTVQALAAQGVRFAPPQGGDGSAARGAEATAEELKAVLARANV